MLDHIGPIALDRDDRLASQPHFYGSLDPLAVLQAVDLPVNLVDHPGDGVPRRPIRHCPVESRCREFTAETGQHVQCETVTVVIVLFDCIEKRFGCPFCISDRFRRRIFRIAYRVEVQMLRLDMGQCALKLVLEAYLPCNQPRASELGSFEPSDFDGLGSLNRRQVADRDNSLRELSR